ncbi:MAG: glycosyltransferase family 4 protein, partial [Planctomycetota bacterium]
LSNGLGDTPTVLFIGRKDHGKGYHALREAVGLLHGQGKAIKLVSIGRDREPPYPVLPDSIDIDLGAADEQTKHDAFAGCDVFALPSEAESFGIVYVEAWSYGKPVIGGTAPASRELIQRHNGGLLSDGSAADIAVQLSRLIDNPAERRAFGESGRAAVLSDYSLEQVMATHHAVWKRLIEEVW